LALRWGNQAQQFFINRESQDQLFIFVIEIEVPLLLERRYKPHAMKTLYILFVITSLASSAWPADVYVEKAAPHTHCPHRGGAPANTDKAKQNIDKNRWNTPLPADFDNQVTAQALIQPGNDQTRWSNKRAARIRGYVAVVKLGTKGESCNCGAKAAVDSDTHIAVVADSATAQDKRTYIIVEVTPRIRENLASQTPSIDWSTDALKKRLLGKRVNFEGWMFFDSPHKSQATNSHPNDPKHNNWRATCWEIHPVTSIQVLGLFD
jgi:hypothetical protein